MKSETRDQITSWLVDTAENRRFVEGVCRRLKKIQPAKILERTGKNYNKNSRAVVKQIAAFYVHGFYESKWVKGVQIAVWVKK